jgi:hypothetical protein
VSDEDARRVYIYEVKLTQADGRGGSGWSVIVVTDTLDPASLLRVARIEADRRFSDSGGAEDWIGLDEAKLLHTGVLDPAIA